MRKSSSLASGGVWVPSTGMRGSTWSSVFIVDAGGPGGVKLPWAKHDDNWPSSIRDKASAPITKNQRGASQRTASIVFKTVSRVKRNLDSAPNLRFTRGSLELIVREGNAR